MTFLSVYTPHLVGRPRLLARCVASVEEQTEPVEHVIVHDHVGLGVGGMYADIPNHAEKCTGDYVMVLSDDNILADKWFAGLLRERAERCQHPDVIVFKGIIGDTVQPLVWGREPLITKIDLSCFAVTRQVWLANADRWGHRYEGDFDFIHHLWQQPELRFNWWDRVGFRALQISRGEREEAA